MLLIAKHNHRGNWVDLYDSTPCGLRRTVSINKIGEQRESLITGREQIQGFLETLSHMELISKFDKALWCSTADQMRKHREES